MKKAIKKRAIHRLKILSGQLKGLERMIENDEYCIDILHQTMASKQALSGIEDLILENHLSTHVAHQMKTGEIAKATKEVLTIYQLAKRK